MNAAFRKLAATVSEAVGSPWSFFTALLVIVVWGITGPIFHYSDTWQLYINTGTTVVTFLMVFLIQNTQNRDARAMHLKLDELLRAVSGARTAMVNLKDLPDEQLRKLETAFERLGKIAEKHAAATATDRKGDEETRERREPADSDPAAR
jgi:low affinity Fe/Cu permease